MLKESTDDTKVSSCGLFLDFGSAGNVQPVEIIEFSDAHFHMLFGFPPASGQESVTLVCPHCRL